MYEGRLIIEDKTPVKTHLAYNPNNKILVEKEVSEKGYSENKKKALEISEIVYNLQTHAYKEIRYRLQTLCKEIVSIEFKISQSNSQPLLKEKYAPKQQKPQIKKGDIYYIYAEILGEKSPIYTNLPEGLSFTHDIHFKYLEINPNNMKLGIKVGSKEIEIYATKQSCVSCGMSDYWNVEEVKIKNADR